MAINKKLIFWNNQSNFSPPTSKTDTTQSVYWESIVFFADTKKIWTHGVYFDDPLNTLLTGYSVGTNTALAATDSILGAFGKIQAQLNAKAAINQTMYLGTTQVAINRASGALTLNGVTVESSDKLDGLHIADILPLHSTRDFVNGTLIQTNINYSVSSSDPWILEITGNSYGSIIPFDIKIQGYIYSDSVINYGGISNGTTITGLTLFNYNGYLTFWFPRQAYWQGFNVKAYSALSGNKANTVTSISDVVKPTGITKEVDLSNSIRQSYHSGNLFNIGTTASSARTALELTGTVSTHNHTGTYALLAGSASQAFAASQFTENGTSLASKYAGISHNHDSQYYTQTQVQNFFSGSTVITGYNKSTWDAASAFFNGFNSVTTLSSLPTTKQSVLATLSSDTVFSLNGTLSNGQMMYIKINNTSNSSLYIDLTNSNLYEPYNFRGNVQSLELFEKTQAELRVWAINDKYTISYSDNTEIADWKYQIMVDSRNNLKVSSNFGKTWTTKITSSARNCAISKSGQYQMAVTSYGIQVSTDYGSTWTTRLSLAAPWFNCWMSESGQYQYAEYGSNTYPGSGTGKLYRSANYGSTWAEVPYVTDTFNCFTMSPSGQYLYYNQWGYDTNGMYSSDYGQTWSSTGIGYYSDTDDIKCRINDSGVFIINVPYSTIKTSTGGSTWTYLPIASGTRGCFITKNQNIIITYEDNYCTIYNISSNGYYRINTNYSGLWRAHASYDGKYIVIYNSNQNNPSYMSDDFGKTFYNITKSVGFDGWYGGSWSGKYSTVMGSNYYSYSKDYGKSWISQTMTPYPVKMAIN